MRKLRLRVTLWVQDWANTENQPIWLQDSTLHYFLAPPGSRMFIILGDWFPYSHSPSPLSALIGMVGSWAKGTCRQTLFSFKRSFIFLITATSLPQIPIMSPVDKLRRIVWESQNFFLPWILGHREQPVAVCLLWVCFLTWVPRESGRAC